jgi:preprotein translocase subunit SecF
MRFFKKTVIDFIGKRNLWYFVSSAMMLVGMLSLAFKGINLGIDFRGGTEVIVAFATPPQISDVRTAMRASGLGASEIKTYGTSDNALIIRTTEQGQGSTLINRIVGSLQQGMPTNPSTLLGSSEIFPKIGKELRQNALYAIVWSFVAILLYIAIRFKFVYGLGAVIAIVHDVFTTFGFLSILDGVIPGLNLEITTEIIAAFLTLIGVSVNDTVVIFDRIRENEKIHRSLSLGEIMNKSLNETLSRTIITSGTIFVVLMVLLFFGGEVNRGFAFTMGFGILTGTYSSIYVASAIVLDWSLWSKKKS